MYAYPSIICCQVHDGLFTLMCSVVHYNNVLTAAMLMLTHVLQAAENALHHRGRPWLPQRQCPSLSATITSIMGQPSQTGPAYSNAKHLLAFLNCLLVLYSRRQKEVMLARAASHLEQCQFPTVHICYFSEILRFPPCVPSNLI